MPRSDPDRPPVPIRIMIKPCRVNLPPVGPSRDARVSTPQVIDEFIAGLVPMAMRGKELGRFVTVMGMISISTVEYENVSISETLQDRRRTGLTVTFTKEMCRDQLAR
jgi:hypothetical protein